MSGWASTEWLVRLGGWFRRRSLQAGSICSSSILLDSRQWRVRRSIDDRTFRCSAWLSYLACAKAGFEPATTRLRGDGTVVYATKPIVDRSDSDRVRASGDQAVPEVAAVKRRSFPMRSIWYLRYPNIEFGSEIKRHWIWFR